ncbi:hypothetical protein GCM10011511_34040 [Puia dinghuensis]|uniref:Uncharacterized protein n=1 Tax=Puia dinghuensis TaxID=1792502 RepID=A0A8J2UET6_9BACT|nr:hypothetical protein GCM10011511_34040 [Puia dinghuensis]
MHVHTIYTPRGYDAGDFIVSGLIATYGENNPSNQGFRLGDSDYFLQFCWQYPNIIKISTF